MKVESLHIENFLTISSANVSLADKGLVLVQGVNNDDTSGTSNGAGKSSIPDALCWALYGETAREESGDAVVNDTAKKGCRVSVTLRDGATLYRIARHRKHATFKNATVVEVSGDDGVTWIDQSKGTEKETLEEIIKIMGCSYEVFRSAIYAGQESMPDIPKMTDKQLKMLIEEAAGIERIEAAYVIARAKDADAVRSVENAKQAVDRNATQTNSEELSLSSIRENHEIFETARPIHIAGKQAEHDRLKEELIAEVVKLKKFDKSALDAEQGDLKTKLDGHGALVISLGDHTRAAVHEERQYAVLQADVERLTRDAMKAKGALANAADELKKPCSACGKPHTEDELETLKGHLSEKLNASLVAVRDAKATADAKALVAARTRAVADDYEKTIPSIEAIVSRSAQVASELMEYQRSSSRALALKREVDSALADIERIKTSPNPHDASIKLVEDRIAALKSGRGALEDTLDAATYHQAVTNAVVRVFGPAGVRAQILDTVTPFLNERTAEYLSALSDGNIHATWSTLTETAKGELREKFNIEVTNDKGAKSFKGLSGGEKRKVRLATMLALQDMVAARATKPISLWVGDEIDDALDGAGIERLMGILDGKARDKGTVLVISHNELRDWIDEVAIVTKAGGYSTIEGALNG